ncbi:hypothetical protein BJ085DRAFT_35723 [Dimargaris cristalligena]|uniref:Amino-acid acetyltransferase, mitochondrial n=1 Tax=Dimargaris cristalligena TaxID=215637 RepID=A0A4V1J521_9FUNG|nr:hypothetical protein BJ085DRAFT_35723 [Dimargaris cristalligena]|eukprot:RKP37539.1 hypothetical protein BJ085DRAFT_35723 [Dimargaris cristalligena]
MSSFTRLSQVGVRRFHAGLGLPARHPYPPHRLYLQILNSFPSQREAQHFLQRLTGKRRGTQAPSTAPSRFPESPWVDSLLRPPERWVALVVVPVAGVPPAQQTQVAQMLVHLQQLGLSPVVLLQNPPLPKARPPAPATSTTPTLPIASETVAPSVARARQALSQACFQFSDAIDSIPGGKARPVTTDVFRQGTSSSQPEVDLGPIITALQAQRIPVIAPLALDRQPGALRQLVLPTSEALVRLARTMGTSDRFRIPQTEPSPGLLESAALGNDQTQTPIPARACKIIYITPDARWLSSVVDAAEGSTSNLNFINLRDEYPSLRSRLVNVSQGKNQSPGAARSHTTAKPTHLVASPTEPSPPVSSPQAAQARLAVGILDTLQDCLQALPATASAIIVSPDTVNHSIQNWITDKPIAATTAPGRTDPFDDLVQPATPIASTFPLAGNRGRWSNSLTLDQLSSSPVSRSPPTVVLRHGFSVTTHASLDTVDTIKLQALLESSFRRTLQAEAYWKRIRPIISTIIVVGDYEGAAILTLEDGQPSPPRPGPPPLPCKVPLSGQICHLSADHWVCFWSGPSGWLHIDDYIRIARAVPASFV